MSKLRGSKAANAALRKAKSGTQTPRKPMVKPKKGYKPKKIGGK